MVIMKGICIEWGPDDLEPNDSGSYDSGQHSGTLHGVNVVDHVGNVIVCIKRVLQQHIHRNVFDG